MFSNHYHFVAESPGDAFTLSDMIRELHEKTAKWVNKLDAQPGRKVWHNYFDRRLEEQATYFARLSYTHLNAVKHGLVPVAKQYPWCSAAWFEENTSRAMQATIYRFRSDKIHDEFEPAPEW